MRYWGFIRCLARWSATPPTLGVMDMPLSSMFENMGFRYLGPVDGHNLPMLTKILSYARDMDEPVLLHVKTVKGKGFLPDGAHPPVLSRQPGQGPAKDGGEVLPSNPFRPSGGGIEGGDAMEFVWIFLSR